jgi:ribosomal protein L7Ae-like RNA K-turn-binding protein
MSRRSRPLKGEGPTGPERSLRDLLGLAARAGALVHGTENVRDALRRGRVKRVVLAADASPTQLEKIRPLIAALGVASDQALSREALGSALGRSSISAVAITNKGFARRVAELVAALPSTQDQ